jgi:hypothetical protein
MSAGQMSTAWCEGRSRASRSANEGLDDPPPGHETPRSRVLSLNQTGARWPHHLETGRKTHIRGAGLPSAQTTS